MSRVLVAVILLVGCPGKAPTLKPDGSFTYGGMDDCPAGTWTKVDGGWAASGG